MPDHPHPTPEEFAERFRRRKQVSKLYLRGRTEDAIAEDLDVSQGTVARDITHVGEQWRKESERDPRFRHERELARTEALEYEIWQAWDTSKQGTRKVQIVRDENGGEKTTRTLVEREEGDLRYLALLLKCVTLRRSAAAKVEEASDQGHSTHAWSDNEVQKEMDMLLPLMEKINAHVRDLKAQGGPFPPGYDPGPDSPRPTSDRPPNVPAADPFPCAPSPGRNAPSELGGETETGRRDVGQVFQPAVGRSESGRVGRIQLPPHTIILGTSDAPRGLSPSGVPWPTAPEAPSGSNPQFPEGPALPRPNRGETGP